MKPMTEELAMDVINDLRYLKFFPSREDDRLAIGALLVRMCPCAEAAVWLAHEVRRKWREWEGSGALRGLLSQKFKPADESQQESEYDPLPPLQYRIITRPDGTEGVTLLRGSEPRAIPPPASEAKAVKTECVTLIQKVASAHQMAAPTIFDRPQAPDPRCPHCHGSGWKIPDELRCECTFRSRPLVQAKAPTLAELESEYAHTGSDLSKHAWAKTPAEHELAVLRAMQPHMTQQQIKAGVIEIEIDPRYRGPRESEGVHKETPAGTASFLVQ